MLDNVTRMTQETNQSRLTVASGTIVALRLFDVAYAIDLGRAEALLAKQARSASRTRLTATPPKAMAFDVPPVSLMLGPVTLTLDSDEVTASATARVYDFGAVTIALRVPITGASWDGFVRQVNAVDRIATDGTAGDTWERLLQQVRVLLRPAMIRPEESKVQEDYLIGVVHAFDRALTAAALQESVDLVPLLSGEQRTLSDGARQELLRQRFSYYADDLVVLTWDRAFIYEPRGDSDVMDVLEVANAQLLEMRYYDELLDDELPRMYDLVAKARRTRTLLASKRFADLARRLHTLVAEVTELTERVDNAIKFLSDMFSARLYRLAASKVGVPDYKSLVQEKLRTSEDLYRFLIEEFHQSRTFWLEFLVVLILLMELMYVFRGKM